MASDPDACVPQTLTDFVFDLYDSISLSQLTEEQSRLYNAVFRDLSGKYFSNTPWPSPQSIASECNGDPLFLAIYRELTHRHWHAVSRPSLRDRMEGWDVYRELFDELLMDAEDTAFDSSGRPPKFYILPEWAFDVLHEFVYQFQGFCQFRTTLYASAVKHNLIGGDNATPSGKAPHHVVENLSVLQQESDEDIWNVETVLGYLQRLVAIGTNPKCTVPAYQYFGIFASVTLSRLECLLSDYTGCLKAAMPLAVPTAIVNKDEPKTFEQVVHGVFSARLSLAYHMGISFIMLRRYKDAVTTVGSLCSYMQRGFKTGQLRKLPNSDQLFKNYDRMIALLAVVTQLCPACPVEESLAKTIREKHGGQLSKEAYGDLFVYCSPKFISPAIPDYTTPDFPMENAYKHQVHLLEQELACQSTFRQLRSYLKLYTSLNVDKLVGFGNDRVTLTSMKLVQRQLEQSESSGGDETSLKSAMDIHYYVQEDTISIDEAEKQRRFENYFLGQVEQSYDIRKDVNAIATDV